MADVLTIDNLSQHFGGLYAVEGVSFSVLEGEFFGIIGPNGAGKTTLLNCISGILKPSTGTVSLRSQRIDRLPSHRISSLGVARTFQLAESFRSFSVIDYVLLGRSAWRPKSFWRCGLPFRPTRDADRAQVRIAESLIEAHGLSRFRDASLSELAYGHQKMVDIIRALAAEPQVLLLDEPTSGSSEEERVLLRDLVTTIGEAGITTVVVDHDVGFITNCCSRVFAMASGRPLGLGTAAEVLEMPQVVESYLGGAASHA